MTEPTDDASGPWPRRGFVMTGLMAGFTAATAHGQAQPIRTDAAGLEAGDTTIPVPDGSMPAYAAKPVGAGPFPIVLVIEEIFGVHEHIKDLCRRLAHAGYHAVAPELYARIADLSGMTDVQQIVREVISKAPDAQCNADLDAAAAWAATRGGDPTRLVVTGFCRGGRGTWLYAAHNPNLRAAVAWYGPVGGQTSPIQPRTAAEAAPEIKCPLLGLYGGQDAGIPVAAVQAAAERARAAGRQAEIVVFPDAPHGFNADYRPSYRAADAREGWRRMLEWFRRHGA